MMYKRRRLTAVLTLVLSLGLLSACGSGNKSESSAPAPAGSQQTSQAAPAKPEFDPEGTVTLVTNADPTFNPWHPNAFVESNVINEIIFPGLTRWNADMKAEPYLAKSWTVSEDGLTWTFNLQENVKWHDGQPFTANDVAFTFNEIVLKKEVGANHASDFQAVQEVVVKDQHTVEFKMKQPSASLPSYLTYYTGIIPEHIFKGVAKPFELNSFNKEKPIGTGPFKVEKFVPGSYVQLVANPDYFEGKPKLKSIIFKVVPDNNAQLAQILAGDIQMLSIEDPAVVDKLKGQPNLDIVTVTQNVYYFVALNQENPFFTDKKVRQALQLAIDRKAMIQNLTKGFGEVATGPIPPLQKTFHNSSVERWDYNPEKAKQLLKEAGWTPGPDGILVKDGKKFSFKMETGQIRQLVPATLLVQQYWKAIGVDAQPDVTDWNTYIQNVIVKRQYNASLAWWSTPADPDVWPYYASSQAGKGFNIPGYKSATIDKLLDDGRTARTEADRVKVYNELQKVLADELPYLYLWYPQGIVALNKQVQGTGEGNYAVRALYTHKWFVPAK